MRAAAMLQSENKMSVAGSLRLYGLSFNAHYYRRRPKKARRFDPGVLAGIEEISRQRPTYGSRRLAAQAARELGRPVNRKQAQRIARAIGIISPQDGKKDVIRKARKPRFRPTGPNQLWETDITYVWCGSADGGGYCFNVVDVFTRQWVSHVFSTYATADDHTPQQNGHVESFHGTLKREYIWPHEFARFQDAEEVLEEARRDYNGRIHSSLGYVTPDEFVTEWRDKNGRKRQK